MIGPAGALLLGAALLEGGARIVYRNRTSLPYRPRLFGDYRYDEFVEKVPGPLENRLRAGYRSPSVTLNRFGLRGPEPCADGKRRRLVVIGESDIFGVKLGREADLWSVRLQRRLDGRESGWEVLNGGHPGYNSVQHRLLWEELWDRVRPDAIILRFGGNDLSQAYAMGRRWHPGAVWPTKFLWGMNSRQRPHQRLLLRSCLYYLGPGKALYRRPFGDVVKVFLEENWEGVCDQVLASHEALLGLARREGIPLAVVSDGSLEHCVRTDEDRKALDGLNENWRAFSEGYGPYYARFQELLKEKASPWGVPYLDLRESLVAKGSPGQFFFDGVHWNARGQAAVAAIFDETLTAWGWWDRG